MENMTPVAKGRGTAKTILSGDVIYLYVGAERSVDLEIRGQGDVWIDLMAGMSEFLWKSTIDSNLELANDLSKKNGWAAITVLNANGERCETERLTNHP